MGNSVMNEMNGRPIRTTDDLEPLISYYAGVLGEKPGRLMAALSLLADLEFTDDWRTIAPEFRLSIELAKVLTADVFNQLMAEQGDGSGEKLSIEIETMFARWTNGHHNGG